jgi:hypothetical protein
MTTNSTWTEAGVDCHCDVPGALTRAFAHPGSALISIRTAALAAGLP